jgi:hypothetical protein
VNPWISALLGIGIVAGLMFCILAGSLLVWVRVIGQEMVRLNTNLTLLRRQPPWNG